MGNVLSAPMFPFPLVIGCHFIGLARERRKYHQSFVISTDSASTWEREQSHIQSQQRRHKFDIARPSSRSPFLCLSWLPYIPSLIIFARDICIARRFRTKDGGKEKGIGVLSSDPKHGPNRLSFGDVEQRRWTCRPGKGFLITLVSRSCAARKEETVVRLAR